MICNKSEFTSPVCQTIGWGRVMPDMLSGAGERQLLHFAALTNKNIPETALESDRMYHRYT